MATRQKRRLLTLSAVVGAHLAVLWLLMSSHQFSLKTRSESLQWVWVPRPAQESAESPKPKRSAKTPLQRRAAPASPTPIPGTQESNAIQSTPDWAQELQLAAKNTLAKELEKKQHDADFTHLFPAQPKKPEQFAWDYAATHRVEALSGGGMLIHLSDNCVLVFLPLPIVGCGIGKKPANGDLFEHLRE